MSQISSKLIRFIPLFLFIILAVVLYRGLFLNPTELPSALVGKKMPEFNLSTLKHAQRRVTNDDLAGNIVLLNVWATWCEYCKYEHPYLLDLAKSDRFVIIGVDYKDDRATALQWLTQYRDPYLFSIFDETGSLGLDLGVYGAPETFLLDRSGVIRMRYAGPIDATIWQREFAPLLAQIEAEQGK
jgi:cytochrome c biogenesis protein CcmG, thiol:disulfide interchange protein DsbE